MNELLAFLVLPFAIPAFIFGAVWVSILLLGKNLDKELAFMAFNGTDLDGNSPKSTSRELSSGG